MHKSQPRQESNQALLARVKKEMDEPRIAESTRSPHQPPWPPGRGRAVASRSEILASPTGVSAPRAPSPRSRVNNRPTSVFSNRFEMSRSIPVHEDTAMPREVTRALVSRAQSF